MDGEITFHDWHPVGIEEYGEAAPDPKNPDLVYGGKVTVYNRRTGAEGERRLRAADGAAAAARRGGAASRTSGAHRAHAAADLVAQGSQRAVLRDRRRVEDHQRRPQLDPHQRRSDAADVGGAGQRRQVCLHRDAGAGWDRSPRSRPRRSTSTCCGRAPTTASSR